MEQQFLSYKQSPDTPLDDATRYEPRVEMLGPNEYREDGFRDITEDKRYTFRDGERLIVPGEREPGETRIRLKDGTELPIDEWKKSQ